MLWVGRPEFNSQKSQEFSLHYHVQSSYAAHPASYPMGTGGSFIVGCKADHSPLSNAKV